MECLKSSRAVSVLVDLTESEEDRLEMAEHVNTCLACSESVNEHRRLRQNVRSLPVLHPSADLSNRIRRIATCDRARRLRRIRLGDAFAAWRVRTEMMMKNLMQPIAVPVAGGLISAVLLLATLIPNLGFEVHPVSNDVPTVLFTDASVKDAYWPVIGETDIVVDLSIDESGRLMDYSVVSGGQLLREEVMRRRFESALLLSHFTPATTFGQPTSGKIRVSFRTSRIEIKG